ncbi:MAG: hypothetical protein JO021_17075 [Alphaproteobacteria bacterium]|nr:hypothetical protein [Alphaproteobacteria bacterium]
MSHPDTPSEPLPEAVRQALRAADAALAQRPDDLAARHVRALATHWPHVPPGTTPEAALALGPESFLLHLELAGRLNAAGDGAAAAEAVRLAARLDYSLSPDKRHTLMGPFNGQFIRQKIFLTLNARLDLQAVFETGSYRGETTEFLAQQVECPVHSCELLAFIYELCRLRLDDLARSGTQRAREVTLDNMDSRAFLVRRLPELAADRPVFIYLDAHCTGDLPIEAECAIILAHAPRAVVMIDDFDVPDDPGFRPKDVRPGDFVTLDDLADVFHKFDAAFFPASSADETGMRRGSLLLTTDAALTAVLDGLPELRRVPAMFAPPRD